MGRSYKNFQDYCVSQVKDGNSYASHFLKDGKNSLKLAVEEARRHGIPETLIERVEEQGMLDGSFQMTYEGAERIYGRVRAIVQSSKDKRYLELFDSFDPIADHDLIATGIFCLIPEVREKVGNKLENLYRVVLNVGTGRRKGYALPMKERLGGESSAIIPKKLEQLIASIPRKEKSEDQEYLRMLNVLIQKKIEREIFPLFQENPEEAFGRFDKKISKEKNKNLYEMYTQLRDTYRKYSEFEVGGVNNEFEDPETGQKGVLPSLYQKIALYHQLNEKKFGVFLGCGTGKTAVAVLAQPLIEKQMQEQGRQFRRALVVCPNSAKKAWKKGLVGKDSERYLAERQDVAVISGGPKRTEFLEQIKDKKWIVVNYEQLLAKVNGDDSLLVDELANLGIDYLIFDESHHVKGRKNTTGKGKLTQSAAARVLALGSGYVSLLTGSPIPNHPRDYAIMYHLLNPEECPNPDNFEELCQNNPRILYTMFNEKTIRLTSDEINHSLNWAELEELVELDDVQRQLYQHIVEYKPGCWLIQARKAILDPRLVDPEILKNAGVLGKVGVENSAKYRKLEDILAGEKGPIEKNEKFVIFTSMFREGVTQKEHRELKRKYEEMGIPEEYEKLGLDKSLDVYLQEAIKRKVGKDVRIGIIDGTIPNIDEREKIVEGLKDGLAGIICTTDTGGESLSFTAANHAIFLDDDYAPKTREQAIRRLIRKGQLKKVFIRYLRAKDSLDEMLRNYVDKKTIVIKIATDGYPLTKDEWELLQDTEGKKLADLVRKSMGGVPINVLEAKVDDLSDFEVKKRVRRAGSSRTLEALDYETTDAQRIMQWIGKDPLNCWKNPEFVELYNKFLHNLSVPVIHRAKICDLLGRASRKELKFPVKVLSEGSGPSLLYEAYQDLAGFIQSQKYQVPVIFDRDTSQLMLDTGRNPNKILGNMNGDRSIISDGEYDMVDNESVTLLKNPEEVKKCLLEANRILKPEGLLELVVKNRRFMDGFYPGLEKLGFELISEKDEGFAVSRQMFNKLKKVRGEHFAASYSSKLANTYLILARKVSAPADAKEEFWFEDLTPKIEESEKTEKAEEEERIISPSESRSIIMPRSRRSGARPSRVEDEDFTPTREVIVDSSGIVQSVRKIRRGE